MASHGCIEQSNQAAACSTGVEPFNNGFQPPAYQHAIDCHLPGSGYDPQCNSRASFVLGESPCDCSTDLEKQEARDTWHDNFHGAMGKAKKSWQSLCTSCLPVAGSIGDFAAACLNAWKHNKSDEKDKSPDVKKFDFRHSTFNHSWPGSSSAQWSTVTAGSGGTTESSSWASAVAKDSNNVYGSPNNGPLLWSGNATALKSMQVSGSSKDLEGAVPMGMAQSTIREGRNAGWESDFVKDHALLDKNGIWTLRLDGGHGAEIVNQRRISQLGAYVSNFTFSGQGHGKIETGFLYAGKPDTPPPPSVAAELNRQGINLRDVPQAQFFEGDAYEGAGFLRREIQFSHFSTGWWFMGKKVIDHEVPVSLLTDDATKPFKATFVTELKMGAVSISAVGKDGNLHLIAEHKNPLYTPEYFEWVSKGNQGTRFMASTWNTAGYQGGPSEFKVGELYGLLKT